MLLAFPGCVTYFSFNLYSCLLALSWATANTLHLGAGLLQNLLHFGAVVHGFACVHKLLLLLPMAHGLEQSVQFVRRVVREFNGFWENAQTAESYHGFWDMVLDNVELRYGPLQCGQNTYNN